MMEKRNPAVVAGLMGAAALAFPTTAFALPATEAIDATFSSPSTAFFVGLASGALVAGSAVGLIAMASSRHRRAKEAREAAHAKEDTSSYQPVIRVEENMEPAAAEPSARRQAPVAASVSRPRHMSAVEWEGSGVIRVRAAEPESAMAQPETAAEVPEETVAPESEPVKAASHAATDYADIAENYVRRQSFRSRMAVRAQGVAATLKQRLDADMMDGVPVIARADGTVADLGESWWEEAVGEDAIAKDAGFGSEEQFEAIPATFTEEGPAPLARGSARSIADRIAFVDDGIFPEVRSADELERGDAWDAALKSMDEKISAQAAIEFSDSVGDAETLDEPDNMEPDTSFIHFKVPAGHPEVVDTGSYVDYLIEDEISKNSSDAVRRSSRHFLHMIEGGNTQATAGLGTSASLYVGKHFSFSQAAEA